jgi:hypothetical protein
MKGINDDHIADNNVPIGAAMTATSETALSTATAVAARTAAIEVGIDKGRG